MIFKGNLLQEIGTEIDQIVEVETIQEMITRIEAEIEGTVETITGIEVKIEIRIEIELTQEMKEKINKDLEQIRHFDKNKFCNYCEKQVIQHIGFSDLKTI